MDNTLKRANSIAFPALPSVPSTAFPVLTATVPITDTSYTAMTLPMKRPAVSSDRVNIDDSIPIHGKADDDAGVNAEKKAMKKSRKLLLEWTQSFTRGSAIEFKDHVGEDDVGTIFFEDDGESFGCPISAVQNILQNGLVKDLDCKDPDGVMSFTQGECGNLSEFPHMLETLAAKLLEGALLAREGGFEHIRPIDVTEHDESDGSESSGSGTCDSSADSDGSNDSDASEASDGSDDTDGSCSDS
ncbi:hypothetical protein T484DRAFT_1756552 [Baffinella frigidus]|nr:hypothetical protein T484DRAFT_1756552 [Cryptophyta sp. CCMP2293]